MDGAEFLPELRREGGERGMIYAIAAETEQPRRIELGMSSIPVFAELPDGREQAVKVLEEAAEVYGAWQAWNDHPSDAARLRVIDEVCDMFQAGANLLSAMGVESIEADMVRMRKRNEERGREYA